MIQWIATLALAGAADEGLITAAHEARWELVDRRASATGRAGGYLLAAGFAQAAFGTLLVAYGDQRGSEDLAGGGTALLVTGSISAVLGVPLMLGGSTRAARSIRERGVHLSRAPAMVGWGFYGVSPVIFPVAPVTVPISIVLGIVQMDVNRRVRERAGLPRVRPDRRWWETAPVGATITIVPQASSRRLPLAGKASRAVRDARSPEG